VAKIIELPTFSDSRGSLSIVEKCLPFAIKRAFFIYDVTAVRGGHRHIHTQMALVSLGGKVRVYCQNPTGEEEFWLTKPNQCLLLDPEDWHTMDQFDPHTTLLVLASHEYDKADYITEKYR
jgi:hypothetical protein